MAHFYLETLESWNTTSAEKLNVPALEHSYYSTNGIRKAAGGFRPLAKDAYAAGVPDS